MGPDLPIIMDLSNVYGFKYPDFHNINTFYRKACWEASH